MQRFLIFGLNAGLGAMGELAGHERRGSLIWPGRSAIIGLMGAALGIRRDGDFSALDALDISVAIFDAGVPLRDYHTVQTVPSAAVKMPNSRPEALRDARTRMNTSITLRDYRAGCMFGVAVTGKELEGIASALRTPRFTLYLGRKSCPLSAPTGAKTVEADAPEDALRHLDLPPWRDRAIARTLVVSDPTGDLVHDVPLDRQRWHHGERRVAHRAVEIVAGGAA
ncbi:type I-E CRISPR-associated protein Cas5/CasD [Antarctobacter sp.]|uniref:type I-E CRISPR-associated protein Cas5/CasD n=1 Tax=Antarctobacter sp. TaxID=1872577 RepID=UPI003A951E30